MILDSGATHHMSGNRDLFDSYSPLTSLQQVILGDGRTTTKIHGIGTIDYLVDGHRILLHNVYYVPGIVDTLYSVKQHIKFLHCSFHAENHVMSLTYPTFTLAASVADEVHVTITPTPPSCNTPSNFNAKFAQEAPLRPSPCIRLCCPYKTYYYC